MAAISQTPSVTQIAFACCPANQNPLAALKQRIALVQLLAQAAGLTDCSQKVQSIPHWVRLIRGALCAGVVRRGSAKLEFSFG